MSYQYITETYISLQDSIYDAVNKLKKKNEVANLNYLTDNLRKYLNSVGAQISNSEIDHIIMIMNHNTIGGSSMTYAGKANLYVNYMHKYNIEPTFLLKLVNMDGTIGDDYAVIDMVNHLMEHVNPDELSTASDSLEVVHHAEAPTSSIAAKKSPPQAKASNFSKFFSID